MPTALALSPHLDDAAFSCGGMLATLANAGWRVVMSTVFTGSVPDPTGFALACQTDKGLAPEVDYMALRRAEDVAAARALGISLPRHMSLHEAPHRGYGSVPELFASLREDDGIADDIAAAISGLIEELQPDLILAPQGVGGHVDHLQVICALRSLGLATPALWWRDFPYTVRTDDPKEPMRATFASLPTWEIEVSPEAEAAKFAACSAYASQLGFQFGGIDGLRERLGQNASTERFRLSGGLPAILEDVRAS